MPLAVDIVHSHGIVQFIPVLECIGCMFAYALTIE